MKLTLKEKSVIKLIKDDLTYSNYFFGKYEKTKLFPTLKREGFFSPKRNPGPREVKNGFQIPEWNVLTYLEKISKKTRAKDKDLLEIIRTTSLFKNKEGKYIDNDRTRWYFVKILTNIPLAVTPMDIFDDVIPTWLESDFSLILPGAELTDKLLRTYLAQIDTPNSIKKVEKLIAIVLSTKEIKLKGNVLGKTEELKTKIENYWLEEAFMKKDYSSLIAEKCTNLPIFNLANTIKESLSKRYKKQDYSSLWLTDLSIKEERTSHNTEYFLTQILRELLLEKIKFNPEHSKEIIIKFLSDEYPHYLFKRLGILMIAKNWKYFSKFFNLILDDNKEGYFDLETFWPEIFYLFSLNAQNLSNTQKIKLKKIIVKGPSKDLPDEKKEAYIMHWKQIWYKATSSLPEFEKLYQEIKQFSKKDVNLPYHSKPVVFRDESLDKSPIPPEGFIEKTNKEVVTYLDTYKPTGDFYHHSPEGVYKSFQSAVEINPEKFSNDLDPFIFHDYHMLSSLFRGFEEAWKKKIDINWKNIIIFILKLVSQNWFWNPTEKDRNKYYDYFSWTLSSIGDLLREGCRADDWMFPEYVHSDVEKILKILVNKLEYDKTTYQGDGMSHALNSSWGKIITVIIYLGLRQARVSDKKQEKKKSKWNKSLKEILQKALDKNVFEAYTLLGHYFPNIHYIDKAWSKSKAEEILEIPDEKYFITFMEGYLFASNVYEPIFKLLKKHYSRALTTTFEESRVKERLIEHLGIWYLRGVENINESSLIDKLFEIANFEYIRRFVEFLWHERNHIKNESSSLKKVKKEQLEFKKKILSFWKYTSNIITIRNIYSEEERKVLSELSKLAIYLDSIDKNSFKLLMLSARYVTEDFDSPYFIKYLNQLKELGKKQEVAKYIGTIFLEMLNNARGRIPDYKWENVVEIIEYLYLVGQSNKTVKDLADSICVFYAEHQNYRLRAIYEQNNEIPKK